MLRRTIKYFSTHPATAILTGVNVLFIGVIIGLLLFLHHKPQAPQALIAPHITMGTLQLKVNNLPAMESFYAKLLGMQILSKTQDSETLGYQNNPILQFINTQNLPAAGASDPGLDQVAIVYNSRPGLAQALKRVLQADPNIYQGGTSRGAIGEAFYVIDPQGNTLELYYDTDPSTWPRTSLGNVEGDALPIDINNYMAKYAPLFGDKGMKLGHLQIRIGDIEKGKQFYLQTIGFYSAPSLLGNGQSVSMSDGFYHHDLVINQTPGYDGDPVDKYLGLFGFSFSVPQRKYLQNLETRLQIANVSFKLQNNSIDFVDPWGIRITVGVKPLSWWDSFF